MGIGKLVEEVAGAVAAEQALEVADPNAGTLVKGAAMAAGFFGASKLADAVQGHIDANKNASQDAGPEPTDDANASDAGPEPQ